MNPDHKEWGCPIECPHQSDDSILAVVKSTVSRVTLPILTCAIVGFNLWAISDKENRAPSLQESGFAIACVFFSYYPTMAFEFLRLGAQKYLK